MPVNNLNDEMSNLSAISEIVYYSTLGNMSFTYFQMEQKHLQQGLSNCV